MTTPSMAPSLAEATWPESAAGAFPGGARGLIKGCGGAPAGRQILGEGVGLGIEPRDAVVEHRAGPHVAVLVDRHVIGRCPGGRHLPFLEALLLGVEHRDLVAAIEAEPDAVLVVHHAAA